MIKKKIEGFPMWLDLKDGGISKRLYIKGGREFAFMWILRKEASGIAMDIGANIGYCTLSLAKVCDVVLAIEPDERSFKILEKNIKLNKLEDKVVTTRFAITDKEGTFRFSEEKKPNLSRLDPNGKKLVLTDSIDNYVEEEIPDFIKMDIEGGEVNALKGAMKTLKEAKEMKILIEVHPIFYNKDNDFRKVLEDILALGYKFKYVINAKGKIDKFKKYKCVKRFKQYKHRAVFKGVPKEKVLKWATTMPKDGKKVVRSFLLEKISEEKINGQQRHTGKN